MPRPLTVRELTPHETRVSLDYVVALGRYAEQVAITNRALGLGDREAARLANAFELRAGREMDDALRAVECAGLSVSEGPCRIVGAA